MTWLNNPYAYLKLSSYKKATAAQYQSMADRAEKLRPELDRLAREKERGAVEAAKILVF